MSFSLCLVGCGWFYQRCEIKGGVTGAAVKPDTFKSVDGFAFFRLSCFDHSDLQLFALFIFDVDFSKTYLKTSAENSISEPPNLKIFSPRSLYKVRAFSTRDNVLPLQKPSYGPDSGVSWWSCHKNIVYKYKNAS